MRRKAGALVPLEVSILAAASVLLARGDGYFHGYAIAGRIAEASAARKLTGYGTLYRALSRLEKRGALESHWEAPSAAESEGRPRRRLYRITGAGERALVEAREAARPASGAPGDRLEQGLAT